MRLLVSLMVGVLIGQWLAFGGTPWPTDVRTLGMLALERGDGAAATTGGDTAVPLEASRGVWIADVMLNGARTGRFLVDTGASITLVSPALARALDLRPAGDRSTQLQTVAGTTVGTTAIVASIRVGHVEARDVTAVIHDPGLDLDGILGNTFLGRFAFALDPDRQRLHLRPLAR